MKKKFEAKQPFTNQKNSYNNVVETELNDQELDGVVGGGLRNLVKGNHSVVLALGPKQDDPRDIGNYY